MGTRGKEQRAGEGPARPPRQLWRKLGGSPHGRRGERGRVPSTQKPTRDPTEILPHFAGLSMLRTATPLLNMPVWWVPGHPILGGFARGPRSGEREGETRPVEPGLGLSQPLTSEDVIWLPVAVSLSVPVGELARHGQTEKLRLLPCSRLASC